MDALGMELNNTATMVPLSQSMLHYSLFVAMLALGAGFVFFLAQRDRILPEYRGTMVTSAIICGVAAFSYYFLTSQTAPGKAFPTAVRYFDWTVTTPLLLIKYVEMLWVRGTSFAWKLIIADLFMIVTGFIGELSGTTIGGHWYPGVAGGIGAHYVWGLVSTIGYAAILAILLTEGKKMAESQPEPIRKGIKSMNVYLLTLWGVYPIVYIFEGLSASHLSWAINLDWFNVASSVADVINKVGFGVTAYLAVRALSGDDQKAMDRTPEPSVR